MPWLSREQQRDRNVAIMELWALGYPRFEIAERFDLTPSRISQIVRSFGQEGQRDDGTVVRSVWGRTRRSEVPGDRGVGGDPQGWRGEQDHRPSGVPPQDRG